MYYHSSTRNKTQPGRFASYSERPFLKDTTPGLILIDITPVTNTLLFVHELSATCGGDYNLLSVEDIIRRDSNKSFVAITASRSFWEEVTKVDVFLPSFEKWIFLDIPPCYRIPTPLKLPFLIFLINVIDLKKVYRSYVMICLPI